MAYAAAPEEVSKKSAGTLTTGLPGSVRPRTAEEESIGFPSARAIPRPSKTSGANWKLFIAGGSIALAVAYLVVVGLQNSSVYFLTVSELQSKGTSAQGQLFRVSGNLVPGTLARESSGLAVQFQIADAGIMNMTPLSVTYRGGQIPDIVGDNIEIVAEGKLDTQGTFVANTVLAKCPSRLENAPPDERDYLTTAS